MPDIHDKPGVKKSRPYEAVMNFIVDYNPDEIVLLGDNMNLDSLSRWNINKKLSVEGKRYEKEIESFNLVLDEMQTMTPRITFMEGNHENWTKQYIEHESALDGFIDLKKQLHIKDRGMKWIDLNDIYKVGKMYFLHGIYVTVHHAKRHLEAFGACVCYGHTHTSQTYQTTMKFQDPIMAWGLGCLCDHAPDYMKGRPAKWINQFAVFEINTKTGRFTLLPINIIGGKFIYEGQEYSG